MQPILKCNRLFIMKAQFVIFFYLFSFSVGFSQIPLIANLEVAPVVLSDEDSINFIATVGMNTLPVTIDSISITDLGSTIIVDACYAGGNMTAYGERTDTFNLGVKPAGIYDLILYARGLWCDSAWSSTDTLIVSIGYNSIVELNPAPLIIYPNPVDGGKINFSDEQVIGASYIIYDQVGIKLQEGTISASKEVCVEELHGFYYLALFDEKGERIVRVQIE